MKINQMAEVDCNKLCTTQGLSAASTSRFNDSKYTRAIHANANLTLMVVDKYGNYSKKEVIKGVTYIGEYVFVYDVSGTAAIVAADKLNIIF